jgi:hypothetical protein
MQVTRFLCLGALLMCTGCVAYGPGAGGYGYDRSYGVATYSPAPVYISPPPVYHRPPVYFYPPRRVIVPIFVAPPVVRVPQHRPYRHHHHRNGWRG